jgi:hypothetical protein
MLSTPARQLPTDTCVRIGPSVGDLTLRLGDTEPTTRGYQPGIHSHKLREELKSMEWEYKWIRGTVGREAESFAERLTDLGKEGWEAVGINTEGNTADVLLKRPSN